MPESGYVDGAPPPPPRAALVLVLGICSYVFCPLLAIPGVIIGKDEMDKVRAGIYQRDSVLTAGYMLSWIFLGIMAVGLVVAVLVLLVFGVATAR